MQRELVMGINAVAGLLQMAPERIVRTWIRPGSARLKALEKDLRAAGMTVELADDRALDRLAGRVRHQGVIAEFEIGRASCRERVASAVGAGASKTASREGGDAAGRTRREASA